MLEHSGIDTARLTMKTYDGGHMMYLYRPSLEALSNDIVAFIEGGSAPRPSASSATASH
jgi:carboxypeptidase C (cathepsin A)